MPSQVLFLFYTFFRAVQLLAVCW